MINYSFVIPHHNSPTLLNRCLDSIPQREDIEIIVVDDNSDADKKPQVNRPDVKLIYIDAEHTKGAGRARNYGLAETKGKWLLFADCDDFYADSFLDEIDKFRDSDVDIVFFDAFFRYCEKDGKFVEYKLTKYIKNFLLHPGDKNCSMYVKHCGNQPWTRMIRREYVEQIEARFSETLVCNDGWFSHFTSSKTNKIAATNKRLYYWVTNPQGLTNKRQSYETERIRLWEGAKIEALLKQEGAETFIFPLWRGMNRRMKEIGLWPAFKLLFLKLKLRLIGNKWGGYFLAKERLNECLKEDALRFASGKPRLKDRLLHNEKWYIHQYIVALRHVEYYINSNHRGVRYLLWWYRYKHLGFKMNYRVAPNTIGPGLMIYHKGDFIWVHPACKIGRHCSLRPGVVFGRKSNSEPPQRVIVGDNCDFGVGAKIIGDVKIGNNVKVGAMAVVTKDIPSNAVAVGVPAKVIRNR